MEVYLDVLIIENLIMNYIILWVTARFSKELTSFIKLAVSSLIGAIYCALIFFPSLKFVNTIIFKILLSFVLIVIAFYPQTLGQFIKLLSVFYIVSFIFGGAAFALFYFTNIGAVLSNGTFYIINFPIKVLVISSMVSYFVIKFAWTTIQNRLSKENMYVLINITLNNKKINLKGLVDTGNSLYDPISKYPVIIVEFEAIKDLLPEEIIEIFSKSKENDISLISEIVRKTEWISRFRLIPFSSLGKENGLLVGFKPDEVLIDQIENKRELKNIIIGIYNKKLSKDQSYSALLHPEVINL